ncbi:ras-related protein Rab-23-like isoform X1 [Tigriopus californicus]|uniref:ras-related protein Rab-23-like isoform X1 n=2 Tax=Tigriopus californicus TaxID=6832 RepID=UPI0027D9E4EC|nr:ras-related protein Rab-23-like isoform X1 [Tigriopus californicus]
MYITDLQEEDLEISIKVVIVGNGAVGKSSMIQRYCRGVFTKGYKKTIGVDFLEKPLRILSQDVRLMLWDTAGQEEFDAITKAYYRGAQACVVAFSTTDRASFQAVKKWRKKVEDECGGSSIPMVLVQNKIDLMHQSAVTNEEVEALAQECNMRIYRTSVKEDINICNVFQHLAENYVNQIRSSVFLHNRFPLHPAHLSHSTSLIQIGGGLAARKHPFSTASLQHEEQADHQKGVRSKGRYATPQEYLNNPMFNSLNKRSNHWLLNDKTITLKPLNTLKKRNMHKKLPIKTGCRVL